MLPEIQTGRDWEAQSICQQPSCCAPPGWGTELSLSPHPVRLRPPGGAQQACGTLVHGGEEVGRKAGGPTLPGVQLLGLASVQRPAGLPSLFCPWTTPQAPGGLP